MNDRSHCPTDASGNPQQYFSPVAPPDYCTPVHTVPEPSSLALVLLAIGALILFRRRVK